MSLQRCESVLILLLLVAGCRFWNQPLETSVLRLPTPRLAVDSVGVDLTFVRIPIDQDQLDQTIWAEADEQCVSPQLRSHLNANGVRVGVIGRQLPAALIRLLEESEKDNLDREIVSETDMLTKSHHQRWRSGRRVPIVATPIESSIVLLHKQADETSLTGQSFEAAQGFLVARPYPKKDGQVRVELTPEIHFGEVKQQWIAGEGTFHLKSGKERHVLSDLQVQVDMSPGQALLVSCTQDRSGVGRTLFVDSDSGDPQQKMLFLRVAQSRQDELFDQLLAPMKSE